MDGGGSRGARGRRGVIRVPQIFAQPNNLKQRPLKSRASRDSEIAAEMDTVAAMVWRDSNFNGPTGFLMSVVPQTKRAN